MQPVNVLPTFVSQDADLKPKESSRSSDAIYKDADFTRLVDKHVDGKKQVNTLEEQKPSVEVLPASKGSEIAADGKVDTVNDKPRQESDVQTSEAGDKPKNENEGQSSLSQQTDLSVKKDENAKALDESELFISLLYNSDQTLANEKAKQTTNVQTTSVSKQESNNIQAELLSTKESKQESALSIDESKLNNKQSQAVVITEHKLKAFSKDELIARSQTKGTNTPAQQPSEQVLKDYQKLLQSEQAGLNSQSIKSKSITSDQLTKAQQVNTPFESSQLNSVQLNGNKVSDIATTVSQANKSLLNEQVDSGLYQLPVEPTGKVKQALHDSSILVEEGVTKAGETDSKKVPQLSEKVVTNIEPQLSKQSTEKLAGTKVSDNTLELMNNKVSHSEAKAEKSNFLSAKINSDVMQATGAAENTAKEQPINAQTRQPALSSAQVQALQQAQANLKEQASNAEVLSVEDAEASYAELESLPQDKPAESVVVTSSKVTNNTVAGTASELHSQAIQANQIKQNNDAYNEHQVSEVLNHNVASDTAQIQKNNVLLQQETISIFKKDFADAVKDKVMVMINQKLQQFDITLDPPEFGSMQVRVNLQGEQAAVNFIVQNQQAKDALEENMHKLKNMLAEQGVDVGGTNVEQQNQQQNQEDNNAKGGTNNSSRLNGQQGDELDVQQILSAKLFDSSATGVDYYA